MKKIKFLLATTAAVLVSTLSFAQDWNPSGANTTVDLNRDGNVSIGATNVVFTSGARLKIGVQTSHVPPGPPSASTVQADMYNSSTTTTYRATLSTFEGFSGPFLFKGWKIVSGTPSAVFSVNGDGVTVIGNVTTPSGYKLYVESGILTEKVKVAVKSSGSWSDYVFNKDYKLLSLGEVESYVKQYKHLPGVPSADEVVKEGIDMATMDAKLLEKIEELTLYVIELKKEIEILKTK